MRQRRALLAAIAVAVLLLHAAALSVLGPAWLDLDGPPVVAPRFQVRSVVLAPPARATATAAQAPAVAAAPVARSPALRAAAGAASGPAAQVAPGVAASADLHDAAASVRGPPPQESAELAAAAATTPIEVPVYATRLPPAGRWTYRMQRGLAIGEAELDWAPEAQARYTLRLQGRIAGVTLLDWASQGALDAAGVAPERFALRRRGRDTQAANFQREAGKITFSGPTHELPLLPGAQDRLSWMVQLPAVVAAAPERHAAGALVRLFVAGARGDADVWTFVVQGVDLLGDTPTLKLVREPRKLYDTRTEVWLDPAEHYLPLRVVQTPSGGGAALELRRERELR